MQDAVKPRGKTYPGLDEPHVEECSVMSRSTAGVKLTLQMFVHHHVADTVPNL